MKNKNLPVDDNSVDGLTTTVSTADFCPTTVLEDES